VIILIYKRYRKDNKGWNVTKYKLFIQLDVLYILLVWDIYTTFLEFIPQSLYE